MSKKFIPFLAIVIMIIIASCRNTKKEDSTNAVQVQDTLGLAEYQKWKMENEVQNRLEQEHDQNQAAEAAKGPVVIRSTKSSNAGTRSTSRGTTYKSSGNGGSSSSGSAGSGTVAQAPAPVQEPAPAPQRKGMSHTAKGAIVGAASGAVIGAVANKKNRVGGGVVGGVIGAATGAGVGILTDKKERQRTGN